MNGTDIPRSLCSHVHVGMSIWAREDNECICEQFFQWRVLVKSVFYSALGFLMADSSWEESPWRHCLVDSHFTSLGHISSAAPSSSLLGLLHTPCFQPAGAKHTVLSPLTSPHCVRTQTGFSFFSSMVPWALFCFPPAQGASAAKHCRAHLGSVLKGTLLPHLGTALRTEKRQFQDLKRKEKWLAHTLEGT